MSQKRRLSILFAAVLVLTALLFGALPVAAEQPAGDESAVSGVSEAAEQPPADITAPAEEETAPGEEEPADTADTSADITTAALDEEPPAAEGGEDTTAPGASPEESAVAAAAAAPVKLEVDLAAGFPYLGGQHGALVKVIATGQLFSDVGLTLRHTDGTTLDSTMVSVFGKMDRADFYLFGDDPAGEWEIVGTNQNGEPLVGSISLQAAEDVLSLSEVSVKKTLPDDPKDRQYTFSARLHNDGSLPLTEYLINKREVAPGVQNQIAFPNEDHSMLPLTADKKADILPGESASFSATVDLPAAPTDADAGFIRASVVVDYGNYPLYGLSKVYGLPYATKEGALPNDIFGNDAVFAYIVRAMVDKDLYGQEAHIPEVVSIPVAAARYFNGTLHLSNIDLHGDDFGFLEHFTSLTDLRLMNTSIGDAELGTLPALAHLVVLDIDNNAITSLDPLRRFPNLVLLSAGHNQITDIAPLSEFADLSLLSLEYNQLTDISVLGGLTKLNTLYLGQNNLTDISPLASLPDLWDLDVSHNQISEIAPSLAMLPQLECFLFSGNPLQNLLFLNSLNLDNPELLVVGIDLSLAADSPEETPSQAAALAAAPLGLAAGMERVYSAAAAPGSGSLRFDSATLLPSGLPFTLTAENGGAVSGSTITWEAVPAGETRGFTFQHWQGEVSDAGSLPEHPIRMITGIYVQGRVDVKAPGSSDPPQSTSGDPSQSTSGDPAQSTGGDPAQNTGGTAGNTASPQTGDKGPSPLPVACAGLCTAAVLMLLRRTRKV